MLADNLARVLETIDQSAHRVGRNPEEIRLLAVSKTVDAALVAELAACGQQLFGENYLQEAVEKIPALPSALHWHFIGHLQRNKVKKAVELFDLIQTVDRLQLALDLDHQAKVQGKELAVLVQVNTGREPQKSGVLPEQTLALLEAMREQTELRVLGLMAMPPYLPNPETSRPYFRILRELAEELAGRRLFADQNAVLLSMGLSHDYQVAVEEGATMVRVGTALFGERPSKMG